MLYQKWLKNLDDKWHNIYWDVIKEIKENDDHHKSVNTHILNQVF